ncbi:MAG: sigma-70 family RNA polymerase sigma factor, partial [Myxococcota bacterium]
MEDSFDSRARLRWERQCLTRAKKGDREAFGELYRAFAPELFRRILMPRLGNRAAAEDALSETFRTLYERIDRYEDQGKSLWHWLSRVAVNKATDMHRVKGRTSRALANFESLLAPLQPGPATPGDAVEARTEREALVQRVGEVLERINPRYRKAIELRFLQDRPRQECADVLEV